VAADLLEETEVLSSQAVEALERLRGTPEAFWPLFLQALLQASRARRALLLSSAVGQPWQARLQWPAKGAEAPQDARRCLQLLAHGQALRIETEGGQRDLALRLTLQGEQTQVLAVLLLQLPEALDAQRLHDWALRIAQVPARALAPQAGPEPAAAPAVPAASAAWEPADLPRPAAEDKAEVRAEVRAEDSAEDKAERLHDILRLAHALSQESRFASAAMALCNHLCSRFGAERVSLGWRQGTQIRLAAISHVEHFDAKSNMTRALEEAMAEAVEQDSVLCHPGPHGQAAVLSAHQAYAQALEPAAGLQLCTVPLQGAEGIVGALCLERRAQGFAPAELWELARLGEATTAWLHLLRQRDRWFLLRVWDAWRRDAAAWLGPRHTAWKAAGLSLALFVLLGALLPWPYRVDASLAVRSRDLLFMPAPFDGYLRQVHVDIGDQVRPGAILVELDTRDLLLEASMAEADVVRYTREAEKAMAVRQLAEMQIALARQQQAAAKLELTRFQLAHAQVKAPYEGVVIEGELKKNLGAPVRKGDLLVKLARSGGTYLELEVDQADVHEVRLGSRGEFALVGRPDLKYSFVVDRIDPQSTQREARNVYLVRGRIEVGYQNWWRPGMGGSARIDVGERSLLWVMTHRTIRFLRQVFWI